MRDRYKIIDEDGIHFITSTIVEWLPVFTNEVYFQILIDSMKYCIQNKAFKLFAYVILENHFHCIASALHLSETISSMKKFTALKILEQLEKDGKYWLLNQFSFYNKRYKTKSRHQVWQEGIHPVLISSMDMLRQKVEYIHHNPVRRGYVDLPEHWRYSSARNFILDDHSIIEVDKSLF